MRLLLLFLIVPLIEIALFIEVGGAIGLGWTLLVVVLTAVLGAILVRSQGLAVLADLRGSLDGLRDPTEPLVHGAMVLFSGALLLTPGFFTDAVGFLLLVPSVRDRIFRAVRERIVLSQGEMSSHDVIDAEFEDIGPPKGSGGPSGWTQH